MKDCIYECESLSVEEVDDSVMSDTSVSCGDMFIEKRAVEITDKSLEQNVMSKGNVYINRSKIKQNCWSNCGFLIMWTLLLLNVFKDKLVVKTFNMVKTFVAIIKLQ